MHVISRRSRRLTSVPSRRGGRILCGNAGSRLSAGSLTSRLCRWRWMRGVPRQLVANLPTVPRPHRSLTLLIWRRWRDDLFRQLVYPGCWVSAGFADAFRKLIQIFSALHGIMITRHVDRQVNALVVIRHVPLKRRLGCMPMQCSRAFAQV
jgi:hypothetical protein